jgi:aspartyl-tRNA(Asn)/glutamyl-tRNA(Gln) amidotransferase subunit A
MTTDLADLPVHLLSAEIAAGRLSSSELVGHYLERIRRLDPKLNSFIAVYDEDARRAAEAADLALRAGHRIGPFHGIPIALKDVINVDGRVTTGGSKMWLNRVARNTATVVKKVLGAGMILLGKNHTVEFTMGGWGTNQQLGTPWNPWNAATHLCPGGSSSGSAVAVGARLAPWAIGTDTGGSVRLPAAYCGDVGINTTLGRISSHGILPMSQTLDSPGVLTRSVEDAALLYQLLHGPDPLDPSTLRHPANDPLPDLKRGVRGLRLGVLPAADREGLNAEVLAAYDASVESLVSQGARKIEIALPMRLTAYGNLAGVIITTEVYANYREFVDRPELPLDEFVRARVLAGKNRLAVDYLDALRDREAKKAQFESLFQSMDALLTPTGLEPPIPLEAIDENILPGMLTRWVGFIGLPALAVPNGFTKSGLPISLQIVGRSHDETSLLRIGWAYEQAHSWRDRRPPLA